MRVVKGFSLIEVMVSIVIAGVALLGLAGAQLKSLQFANNSFYYTIALVNGQNAIERMWSELCYFQYDDQDLLLINNPRVANLQPKDPRFTLSIAPDRYNDEQLTPLISERRDVEFSVSWQDSRVNENSDLNQITLVASYVYVPAPDEGECVFNKPAS
ncbi:prepilin-type N-terminal cleavage/methylation domain-containing protein [Pseudoalteromonas sp. SMS1]|uniref:prepilin-type N-terminal cleavage/methylation domain-containing protein n=1 Tax=Pseudoalteromonas sp. SMS1 TaxID=2908894 RepID=UPI001F158A21|nr:prepilin-type N-terminal cleavage/methylation domain-containing protein [Pseudoalteromonas sp. SMS1]MCF2859669.1 prepilin-type N-terminal cleavage/methylation domain-containing protein [Pseudoalteromonas sp. SMS1]